MNIQVLSLGHAHWSWAFNATMNNISAMLYRVVLFVEETEEPVENHLPVTDH